VLARGVLTDSSTTSLNIQPSLVTPLEVIDDVAAIVADAITTVTADRARGGAPGLRAGMGQPGGPQEL
jgi:hypothetical protein